MTSTDIVRSALPSSLLGLVLAASFGTGCDQSRGETSLVLGPGYEYRVHLVIVDKPTLTPERAAALGPLKDSLTGTISVDSTSGDSLFGRYQLDMLQLGVMANTVSAQEARFAGSARGGALSLRLNPEATDAGVILDGVTRGGRITGQWRVQQAIGAGTFVIEK